MIIKMIVKKRIIGLGIAGFFGLDTISGRNVASAGLVDLIEKLFRFIRVDNEINMSILILQFAGPVSHPMGPAWRSYASKSEVKNILIKIMAQTPLIHNKTSPRDKYLEAGALMFLIIIWVVALIYFPELPTQIPTHYNTKGQVDGMGYKTYAFVLPILSALIYGGLTMINRYPHLYNHPGQVEFTNLRPLYNASTRLIRIIKFMIMLVLCMIVLTNNNIVFNTNTGLGVWFLPFVIGLLIIPNLVYLAKIFKSDNG